MLWRRLKNIQIPNITKTPTTKTTATLIPTVAPVLNPSVGGPLSDDVLVVVFDDAVDEVVDGTEDAVERDD